MSIFAFILLTYLALKFVNYFALQFVTRRAKHDPMKGRLVPRGVVTPTDTKAEWAKTKQLMTAYREQLLAEEIARKHAALMHYWPKDVPYWLKGVPL